MGLAFQVPVSQTVSDADECKFPGDCRVHTDFFSYGPCESRTAYKIRYWNATKDERREMHARASEGMEDRIIRTYELDDAQAAKARGELKAAWEAHQAAMGPAYDELLRLRRASADHVMANVKRIKAQFQRLRDHYAVGASNNLERLKVEFENDPLMKPVPGIRNDPVLVDIRRRMRAIDRKYPFDWNKALDKIERSLPKEKAAKGRKRLMEEVPHRFTGRSTKSKPEKLDPEQVRRNRAAVRAAIKNAVPADMWVHPWKRHVRRFIKEHNLTEPQAVAAMSILDELRDKAAGIEQAIAFEVSMVRDPSDEKEMLQSVKAYEQDIHQLRRELDARLDSLLTTSQRQSAKPAQEKPDARRLLIDR
jgi:hypothetical protein